MTVFIKKWGNSLGIRIPAPFLKEAGLSEGQEMDFSITEKGVLLTPTRKKRSIYTLDQLLSMGDATAPKTDDVWKDDQPVGREVW